MRRLKLPVSTLTILVTVALILSVTSCTLQLTRSRDTESPQSTTGATIPLPKDVPAEFGPLFEVWETLKRNHLDRDSLDPEKIGWGAIRGMLKALEDPYASFLEPEVYSVEAQDFKGVFSGIGAEVTVRDGKIVIISPIQDTPAERAGVRPGDIILEINGVSTQDFSLLEAVNKIRGPRGTPVEVTLLHKGASEPVTLTIIRDNILVKSVNLRMLVGGIAHLQIRTFTDATIDEVEEALGKARDFEARGIILDLRNNPGGVLGGTVDVASHFLDKGLVLYEIDGRGQRTDWKVRSGGLAKDIPLVTLVNQYSASASEVLAGALSDQDRSALVGEKTFGKGSVNTLQGLSDGSGVYFTTARWYTPSGILIEGEGLEPDILVSQPEEGGDDQLDRAIEVLEGVLLSRAS